MSSINLNRRAGFGTNACVQCSLYFLFTFIIKDVEFGILNFSKCAIEPKQQIQVAQVANLVFWLKRLCSCLCNQQLLARVSVCTAHVPLA